METDNIENKGFTEVDMIGPGYRKYYNVNPNIFAVNFIDDRDTPLGGEVKLPIDENANANSPLYIRWQDGPRGQKGTNKLLPPNGAFVEDVLWAALQRLEFFNTSKYKCRANSIAITKIEEALHALKDRQLERSHRGVEGKMEV